MSAAERRSGPRGLPLSAEPILNALPAGARFASPGEDRAFNSAKALGGTDDAMALPSEVEAMSPFLAALVACAYMGVVFVFFGWVPRRRKQAH